jgi:hypothetical protein
MDVALPGIGKVVDMAGRRIDDDLFLTWITFTAPATVLSVSMADGAVREVGRPTLAWEPAAFVTEQVFVSSDDGTRVPLFLSRRRDIVPDGTIPTLLYGYGGFQIAVGPMFKPEWLAWMERGGLLAVASLRGGGEYGKSWHDDGRLANKQHVFDDFAACARWLAASGWTSSERIAISGRSNGGAVWCRDRRGRSHGHASVPSVHDRLGMDQRLWIAGRPRPVPNAPGVLAAPQHPTRRGVPGNARDDGRPRRPGRAGPLIQVRGGAPGGAGR